MIALFTCSLYSTDYGTDYFKKFTLVMNALDNRGNHLH